MIGKQRSVKNTIKNVSLVLLAVLMACLCLADWLSGLGVAQMPADSGLRRLYDQLFGGAVGYEVRSSGIAAADPCQLALTVDGRLYSVQYAPSDVDAGLEAMSALWSEALTVSDEPVHAEEGALTEALAAGDCAALTYLGGVPLSSAAGWLGGRWESDIPARTIVYAAGTEQVFIRTADGALYAAAVRVQENTLRRAQSTFHGQLSDFAGAGAAVWPETVLPERESLSLDLLRAAPASLFDPQTGGSLQTLLEAFSYTPYASTYDEQGGAVRVFVSAGGTLRIADTGMVQFTSAGSESTVRAYDEGEASGLAALDAQIDCARQVLDTAVRAAEAGTQSALYAVQRDGADVTLVFTQLYSGVPVLGDTDFATLVFRDGNLLSATVYLQQFTPTGETHTVLPARQAAAGAAEGQRTLLVAYRMENETYRAERVYA